MSKPLILGTDLGFQAIRQRLNRAMTDYIGAVEAEVDAVARLKEKWIQELMEMIQAGKDIPPMEIASVESLAVIAQAQQFMSQAMMIHVAPIAVEYACNGIITEMGINGSARSWLDWLSAASAVMMHKNPIILEAALRALNNGGMTCTPYFMNRLAAEASEKIATILPGTWKVSWTTDGGNANEAAAKIALVFAQEIGKPSRIRFASFKGAYLGNQGTAGRLTGHGVSTRWGQAMKEGYIFRMPDKDWQVPGFLRELRTLALSGELAGFFVEAIPGDKGMQLLPEGLLQGMVDLLWGQFQIPVIFDEIQSGFGRTGKTFAWQWWLDSPPPMVTFGKSAGNGIFTVSGVLYNIDDAVEVNEHHVTLDVLEAPEQLSTYAAGTPAMAVLLETLSIATDEATLAEIRRKGEILQTGLQEIADLALKGPVNAEVKGMGLMSGLEIWWEAPRRRLASALATWLARRGVIVGAVGNSTIRLHPSLFVSENEIRFVLALLKYAMERLVDGTFDEDLITAVVRGEFEVGLDREKRFSNNE